MIISVENLKRQSGHVGIVFYYSILSDLKKEKSLNVLKISDVFDYLSHFKIDNISDIQTRKTIRKMRIESENIRIEHLVWESFIVTTDKKYWRPYSYEIRSDKKLILKMYNTLSFDGLVSYASLDPQGTMRDIEITIGENNSMILCLLALPTVTLEHGPNESLYCTQDTCKVKHVYHGTPYRMLDDAENAPYNFFGNWFTLGLNQGIEGGESLTYTSDQSNQTVASSYLYKYKIKKPIKVLYFEENNQIDYLFIHMMYFNTSIKVIDNTQRFLPVTSTQPTVDTINTIAFEDSYTIRQVTDGMILKYNYTQTKNLLDKSLTEPNFTKNYWSTIKSELTDDGDKGVAAVLCDYYNKIDKTIPLRLQIHGWVVQNIFYLMSCNPKDILENIGVFVLFPSQLSPSLEAKYNLTLDKYVEVLIGDDTEIIRTTIGFGNTAIYVPKHKYELYRRNLNILKKDMKPTIWNVFFGKKYSKKYDPLITSYKNDVKEKYKEESDANRLIYHENAVEPDTYLVGGEYYKKYIEYKSKYLNLKN